MSWWITVRIEFELKMYAWFNLVVAPFKLQMSCDVERQGRSTSSFFTIYLKYKNTLDVFWLM